MDANPYPNRALLKKKNYEFAAKELILIFKSKPPYKYTKFLAPRIVMIRIPCAPSISTDHSQAKHENVSANFAEMQPDLCLFAMSQVSFSLELIKLASFIYSIVEFSCSTCLITQEVLIIKIPPTNIEHN